jgi:hypothetical protein
MGFLEKLRARFGAVTLEDPDFGRLHYMHIAHNPSKSYWECEWMFPPTRTRVSIGLPGNRDGPLMESRAFYLTLVDQFTQILTLARPGLDEVFRTWLNRPLHNDLWQDLRLSGFSVEDPRAMMGEWEVMFETIGSKWLAITVPFVGDQPKEPVVDT